MNNELQIFNNEEFGQVRSLTLEGEPWFVAKDIADVLGFSEASAMTRSLDEDEKGMHTIQTLGGEQKLTIISESGLYSAILKSRKPEAKKFKKWVTSEILPSIRKHGAYMTEDTLEKALTNPDFLIQLATKLKEEQIARKLAEEKVEKQNIIIEELQPTKEIAERFTNDDNSYDMNLFSKVLNIKGLGRNNLFAWLRDKEILRHNNEPYQKYMENFNVILLENKHNDKKTPKTLVKSKGVNFIVKKLIKDGYIIVKSIDEILEELNSKSEK